MQTNHILKRFEVFVEGMVRRPPQDQSASEENLRRYFEEVPRNDRELLVGLAAMRWSPRLLEALSGMLYIPRFRSAFLAGLRNRFAQGITQAEAQRLVELVGVLCEAWPTSYADELDALLIGAAVRQEAA